MKYEEISKGLHYPPKHFTVSYYVKYPENPITLHGEDNFSGTYVDKEKNEIFINVNLKEPNGKKQTIIKISGQELETKGNEKFNENDKHPLFVGELDNHLVYFSFYTWSIVTLSFFKKSTDEDEEE